MTGSRDYEQGFAAGWLAASQALMRSLGEMPGAGLSSSLAMAGNKPSMPPRPRGRPRKSAPMAQPQPIKRGRGRPRKTG